MKILDAKDILNIAIRIEDDGEKFYRRAAGMAEDDETKEMFRFLADEEKDHQDFFRELEQEITDDSKADYPEEYMAYISAYVDNVIFPADQPEDEAEKIQTVYEAINYSIRKELESVLFYHEIKPIVVKKHHDTIDRIIEEEREHFVKFVELKRERKENE